jgi:hypothetical protein
MGGVGGEGGVVAWWRGVVAHAIALSPSMAPLSTSWLIVFRTCVTGVSRLPMATPVLGLRCCFPSHSSMAHRS